MTPETLRAAALLAASRGEWIKAAALKEQADDLERLQRIGRDPYRPAFTDNQRAKADAMLAGCAPLTLES